MLRFAFVACGLIASAICAARPMVIHQSQILVPPAGSGYYFFGYEVAIDGDWAIVIAATPSPTPTSPQQTHDALLYHRVNGQWTFDRVLVRRVSTEYGDYVGFRAVAMSNGLAAIGSDPTRIFRRTNDTWAEIAHPFTAPPGDPNHVEGELEWDGNTLLAAQHPCTYFQNRPWGALISTFSADGSWSPVERLASDDTFCNQDPVSWGISGDTVVAGVYSNDYEVVPDQLRIFRDAGSTWVPTSAIDGGNGQGDIRGDEIFFSSRGPGGTLVYRNDDTHTVVDNIRTVSASYREAGQAFGFTHTDDDFLQGHDVFRKNAAGRYEHVARLLPTGRYALVDEAKINGRRVIFTAWRNRTSSNQEVMIFDLPATYTPSPVIATGFENGAAALMPQLGTFAVATRGNGNRVYRQSSLAGEYRAMLRNSDWIEQSIEAVIRPTAFSGADRWAGLAVRYLDSANYYYVTLRSSGVVELKRMLDGVYTTLAQKPLPIVAGRYYHVALQASGSMITVRIDGKEFIWSDDDEIPHGSAALLGYRTAVDYDNVVASQIGQQPIFELPSANCYGPLTNFPFWTTDGTGDWTCSDETGQNVMHQSSTAGVARALVGTPTDDQVVTTRVRLTASGNGHDPWLGIAARYVDESNYYYLSLRTSNTVSLRKLVNGVITELGTAPYTVTPGTWYRLRLDAVGNEIRGFVNSAQVMQVIDSSHPTGQGGVLTYKIAAEYMNYFAWQP